MAENSHSTQKPAPQAFVISRTFDSPRDLVWKAFTDPERMKRWWGPKGFTVRYSKMEFRPGGIYHYCLRSPAGEDMWGKFVYREIVKPERVVFVDSFSDEEGNVTTHPLSPNWPRQMLSTVTLTKHEGGTTFTVEWIPMNASASECETFESGRESMRQGWTGTLDQLAGYLANP